MKEPCSSLSEMVQRYFDREVTAREKALVEDHLRDCPSCRNALGSMEQIRRLMAIPAEDVAREDDFGRVFTKVKREIRTEKSRSWWENFRVRVFSGLVLPKKVWVPAVAAVVLLLAATPFFFKKSPSYPDATVVEYIESDTNNVMIYESEKGNTTVIWLIEEKEPAA